MHKLCVFRVKVQLQNRTHEKVSVEISKPDEPFSIKRLHLEMKELDQTYFLTEQIRIKRKYTFFESFEKSEKISKTDRSLPESTVEQRRSECSVTSTV